jgi:hypothetical protein
MANERRKLRDAYPAQGRFIERFVDFERGRLEYLLQRRDTLHDRIRFGLLTINGASLVALLAALGGNGNTAKWMGISHGSAMVSALAFIFGGHAALFSIAADYGYASKEIFDASKKWVAAEQLESGMENFVTPDSDEQADMILTTYQDLPRSYGHPNITSAVLHGVAAASWSVGVISIILLSI